MENSILRLFQQLQQDVLDIHTFLELAGGHPPLQSEAVLETVMDLVHQGLLAERGCDFFSLTEAGRLATAAPRDLTLLSRPGCHLCTEVKARLLPLLREFRLILREVDIDRDAALRAQYSEEIPVIFLGAAEIARHSIDGNRLRQLLRKHLPS